ncbi:MAG: nicotinamidase [Planctomycetes bacterium]|nr:nicotinamidase [Planctomycetota bacterium]
MLSHRVLSFWMVCSLALGAAHIPAGETGGEPGLTLQTRSRVAEPGRAGEYRIVHKTVRWDPRKTAVIICDMWARHWCDGACRRGAELAPRIDAFVTAARQRGALIVHAPSGGMEHYANHPARLRAQQTPQAADVPEGMAGWNNRIASEEGAVWPLDQSDGGCDDQPRCPNREMDVHQTAAIRIDDSDAISDSGVECWNLFAQRGIDNVILVGVHTNMCVIGRPFGLRNMVRVGKNVLLARDLTDTMYNPRQAPLVSHVRGTEMIVEYIEKYVCPTIVSSSLLGGPALRFSEDKRPHVAIIVSDDHYRADAKLPAFAQMLGDRYGLYCTVLHGEGEADIRGLDELQAANVLIVYVRRLALPADQLAKIRAYVDAGKPLVALRTASHAFSVRDRAPADRAQWPAFDKEVLGGNYHGHGSDKAGTDVTTAPDAADHPIVAGVSPSSWHSSGSLYYVSPIDPSAKVVLTGSSEGKTEPLAWVRQHRGGTVVYNALGHWDDFEMPQFQAVLVNSVFFALGQPVPEPAKKIKTP